ncbi:MAG: hypothetical protein ACOYM8_18495, partial [Caulobacterales bacterium]
CAAGHDLRKTLAPQAVRATAGRVFILPYDPCTTCGRFVSVRTWIKPPADDRVREIFRVVPATFLSGERSSLIVRVRHNHGHADDASSDRR